MEKTLGSILREYMYKDIFNQGETVLKQIRDYERQVEVVISDLDCENMKNVYVCGCGDSYYVGEAAREAFYRYAGLNLIPSEAYEFVTYDYRRLEEGDLVIGVSVSGNVGTSLECLERAREKRVWTLGINNCKGSPIWSVAYAVVDIQIPVPKEGPVPLTCHYLANLTVLFLMALRLGVRNRHINQEDYEAARKELCYNLDVMRDNAGRLEKVIWKIAEQAVQSSPYVITGHGVNLATARFAVAKLHEAAGQGHIVQETEEWAHEERQMTKPDTFTFVFVSGQGARRAIKILEIMDSFGSHGIAIAREGDRWELKAEYRLDVKMADNEAFSPMSLKLPMELFAYDIAELLDACPFHFDNVVQTRAIEKLIYKEQG